MSYFNVSQEAQSVIKTIPSTVPGLTTITAYWFDIINHGLSIIFLSLSIAYLAWRWWVAYRKESG